LRNQDPLADRTYSIGPVPPALTNRPASSVAGIAARDTPAVVMIKVNGDQGTGSGFLIPGGYIVTDNHVVTLDGLVPGATLEVYFSNGKSAKGVLVGRDPYSDIAVVRAVGLTNLPALTLGNSSSVQVGDPVIAIGSPLGLADTVTSGIVSAVDRPVQPGAGTPGTPQDFFDAIQTDAPINPGNSGGPLVNARGQVIGVDAAIDTLGADPITGTQGGSIGLGFAIPIDQVRRVVVQLIRSGHATHSVIGADVNDNYSGNGAQLQGGVVPGGPAAQAGLRPGDVVTSLGGQQIASAYALLDAVRSLAPGTSVPVGYIRHGQPRHTNMTLGSASS
jgi:putative serine protease PepD